ncbi:four helix bundle protein [soil metagenome]
MSNSYTDLLVWRKSFELTKSVYLLTNKLPKHEQYGLSSQVQHCAVSIPSNIAEGQQRKSTKEFMQFLSIARGSATELSTQLLLIQEIYTINTSDLINTLEEVQKMLYSLQNKL